MLIDLAYGRTGLTVDLPAARTTVIEPTYSPGLPDQTGAVKAAVRNPIGTPTLREMAGPSDTVAISVCDITRPMPSSTVLPVILDELARTNPENVVILIATGTHRANTRDEIGAMLGDAADSYRVVSHSAFDPSGLCRLEDTPTGVPVWLNRLWVESDVRITTGFVEPHFFAGFSGGPKMVAPGLAGLDTIMRLHDAEMIGDPRSTWGVTQGNPIHGAIRQIAGQTGVDFAVDVTTNRDHRITAVYAGELFAVHRAACGVARRAAMRPVQEPFPVVVTTNSGYPLDQNLYQTVKGMSAAAQIVRQGGTIVCASECSDGIPDHGEYKTILSEAANPSDLLERIAEPGYRRQDQWQVQIQAQIQMKADVKLKSDCLTAEEVRAAHLGPVDDVADAVEEAARRHGNDAAICVLPQGPQTIPYLDGQPT